MSARRRIASLLVLASILIVAVAPAPAEAAETDGALTLDPSLQEIPPAAGGARPGAAALLLLVFALLIVLPFVPGLFEVYRPRDRYPLPIDTIYTKDPRFFGISARRLLAEALDVDGVAPGVHEATLSRPESIEVRDDHALPRGTGQEAVLVARGTLEIGAGAACSREVYVRGEAKVGEGAELRALSCEGDVELAARVMLRRWLDADGNVAAGPDCVLGNSVAAGGRLTLADGVAFSRLYGSPVVTAGGVPGGADAAEVEPERAPLYGDIDEIRTIEDLAHVFRGDTTVSPGESFRRPLVVKGDLVVAAGASLPYAARVYGDLRVERGATIHGDAFVEGDVYLDEGAAVRGNVFSQARIRLAPGARVGRPDARKSLIGKTGVELGAGVVVHGYILTDGRGRVSCAGSS